ncbi:MAG TPA: MOSC N-terminal beta barrel domain-containing protein [Steroidobacteraceae bacterium]|nr:MOSC N-terminal beta barrel domain-containing protein [Steroidobacteraceae bacterium]
MKAVIRHLFIYPVKSTRAIPQKQARLAPTGLEWDRHWMAASPDGVFMSQRTQPRLARVTTEIGPDVLTLRAPDQPPLTVPLRPEGETRPAEVWKSAITALDQGEAAARWLTQAVGTSARLLRISPILDRQANAKYAGPTRAPVSFADGFPLLIVNLASLAELNSRMPEPVPLERFRPNLALEGLEPFAEDHIDRLEFGNVTLRLVKPCTRCVITSTDQRTGEPSTNPLPVLRTFRFDRELKGVTFGENAVIAAGVGETLSVGDHGEVVLER